MPRFVELPDNRQGAPLLAVNCDRVFGVRMSLDEEVGVWRVSLLLDPSLGSSPSLPHYRVDYLYRYRNQALRQTKALLGLVNGNPSAFEVPLGRKELAELARSDDEEPEVAVEVLTELAVRRHLAKPLLALEAHLGDEAGFAEALEALVGPVSSWELAAARKFLRIALANGAKDLGRWNVLQVEEPFFLPLSQVEDLIAFFSLVSGELMKFIAVKVVLAPNKFRYLGAFLDREGGYTLPPGSLFYRRGEAIVEDVGEVVDLDEIGTANYIVAFESPHQHDGGTVYRIHRSGWVDQAHKRASLRETVREVL